MQTQQERRIEAAQILEKNELFRRKIKTYGKRNWLTIPEDRKAEISNKIESINKLAWGTVQHLTNPKNRAEIQSRIMNVLKPTEDDLNNCIIHANNPQQLHFCLDVANKDIDSRIPRIKEILREY